MGDAKCPEMTAGKQATYYWASKGEKAESLPAPQYVNKLVSWISEQLDDEKIFPAVGAFPKNFRDILKKILSRMFRVYAHLYHSHWESVKKLGADVHLNTCFKHFYTLRLNLIWSKKVNCSQWLRSYQN